MHFDRRFFLKGMGLWAGGGLLGILRPASAGALLPLEAIRRHPLSSSAPLKTLCFGSCNRQDQDQSFWTTIGQFEPDLFVFMGDNIYADTRIPAVIERKYKELKNNPYYRKFIENVPMIGTWDDHDYGDNNEGRYYEIKRESQQLFLDFFNEPKDSPIRSQEGIYRSYELDGGRVKVIMLDTRYHRDDPYRWSCSEDRSPDILGEEQWEWFEDQLAGSQAEVHLIGSSIGALADSLNVTEDWDKFPCSRQRLIDLLVRLDPAGTVILTGDKHFGGIFPRQIGPSGKPVLELMSSGLTHAAPFISHPIIRAAFKNSEIYLRHNFGRMIFDLDNSLPQIKVEIRDLEGQVRRSLDWSLHSQSLAGAILRRS